MCMNLNIREGGTIALIYNPLFPYISKLRLNKAKLTHLILRWSLINYCLLSNPCISTHTSFFWIFFVLFLFTLISLSFYCFLSRTHSFFFSFPNYFISFSFFMPLFMKLLIMMQYTPGNTSLKMYNFQLVPKIKLLAGMINR